MHKKLNFLFLENINIYQQLQIEEALLRADEEDWCIVNMGSPLAIVVGISGKKEQLIDLDKTKKQEIPIIKRFSGGGTVVVDKDTIFVTFIRNSEPHKTTFPEEIHRWIEKVYQDTFRINGFRFFQNDFVIFDHKCGGNAQYIRKGRWLYHSTFLWDFSQENMDLLLMPAKTPAYRLERPHHEFLCTLSPHFMNKNMLLNQFLENLHLRFSLKLKKLDEIDLSKYGVYRKTTTLIAHE